MMKKAMWLAWALLLAPACFAQSITTTPMYDPRNETLTLPSRALVLSAQAAPLTPAQVQAELTQALTDAGVDPTIAAATSQMLQLALTGAQTQAMLAAATTKSVTDLATKEDSDIANVNARIDAGIAAIPAGPAGATGADATVQVGAVTTGLPGSLAVVTNSGTPGAAVLNFSIPQGATGLPGPQAPPAFTPYAVPPGYVIPILADSMSGCLMSGGKCTGWTSTKNGCGIYGVCVLIGGTSGDSGSFYDANVIVPQAGTYTAKMNVAITSGSATISGHFECPVGTVVGTWTYTNNGSVNPAVVSATVTLPAGPQTVRMSLDVAPPLSNGNGTGLFNWVYLARVAQ